MRGGVRGLREKLREEPEKSHPPCSVRARNPLRPHIVYMYLERLEQATFQCARNTPFSKQSDMDFLH